MRRVGAGLNQFCPSSSHRISTGKSLDITRRNHRAKLKNQKPAVIWMTGLSGSGKS